MSTVIKAGRDFELVKRLTTIDLADHLAEARRVIDAARVQARTISARARQDAAVARRAAREEGRTDGHAAGHQAGYEAGQAQGLVEAQERFTREQAQLVEALGAAVAELNARKRDLLLEAHHDVLEFAIALAGRVARRVGELNRSAATANLQEALRLVSGKTDVSVRVHPLDGATMRQFAGEMAERAREYEHVRVMEDESVAPGGCRVTAGGTEIDAGIDTQMDGIVSLLLGETSRGPEPAAR